MRHFLEQFGPALEWPWTKLTDVPELTPALIDKIAAQSDEQAGGLSVRELERLRDDNLVALLQALRARRYAAGAVLHEHEARLLEAAAPTLPRPTRPDRCALYEGDRRPGVGRLQRPHDRGALPPGLRGRDRRASAASSASTPTTSGAASARTRSRRTSATSARSAGLEPLAVETQILGADEKRLHVFHTMTHRRQRRDRSRPASTCSLHVDTERGTCVPVAGAGRRARRRRRGGTCAASGPRRRPGRADRACRLVGRDTPLQIASRSTPRTTRTAPASRAGPTRSWRNGTASAVAMTTLVSRTAATGAAGARSSAASTRM